MSLDAGFVVLRRFFDPVPLASEFDRALAEGVGATAQAQEFDVGACTVSLQYVPMMCERTPVSLDLTDALAAVAEDLLRRPVLPGRSKGTRYVGDTGWHRDSERDVASLGCVAYLDPLTAATGALTVLPYSHADRHIELPDGTDEGGVAIGTQPGDVIVFDERLIHGSRGGSERRQWRVDFIADPTDGEAADVRQWFAQSLPDERGEVGYDARAFPSYGEYWRSRHAEWAVRLADLGVLKPVSPRANAR